MGHRFIHRRWRNGPGGKWTCRITWYDDGTDTNIRLEAEDTEMVKSFYPKSKEEANKIWERFRLLSPRWNDPARVVVAALVKSLADEEKESRNG